MSEKENKSKKNILTVFLIALGFFLLLLGNGTISLGDGGSVAADADAYDEKAYEEELVAKIEGICKRVKGAGEVSVAISLDGSYKAVLAQNSNYSSSNGNSEREYVLVGSGSSKSALPIGYTPPEIRGIGIVCDGGGNPSVRAEIIALISAAFDLPTNKIYVTSS